MGAESETKKGSASRETNDYILLLFMHSKAFNSSSKWNLLNLSMCVCVCELIVSIILNDWRQLTERNIIVKTKGINNTKLSRSLQWNRFCVGYARIVSIHLMHFVVISLEFRLKNIVKIFASDQWSIYIVDVTQKRCQLMNVCLFQTEIKCTLTKWSQVTGEIPATKRKLKLNVIIIIIK